MVDSIEKKYKEIKQAILKKRFSRMNPMQQEAVFQINGPVLILAGAGSGKTTVVVNRIANMIEYGNAYQSEYIPPFVDENSLEFLQDYLDDKVEGDIADEQVRHLLADYPVKPWNILAITFTNKAAGELKERLEGILGEEARDIQASTFHSACVRILRREIENLGYAKDFTIYDSDDSQRIIKEALKEQGISDKNLSPRSIQAAISNAKDAFIEPDEMLKSSQDDFRTEVIAKVFQFYQKRLKSANALDFDDIIVLTVKLFQKFPEILEKYQNRYQYIMVDEYQDTNNSQFLLVSMLAQKRKNICVVGDDDQSIYKFRGATIENILNFESQYQNTKVIRLEQNYRCSQTILDAANSVIGNNTKRKGKTLWTDNGEGSKIKVYRGLDEQDEARFIANTILDNVKNGAKFADHAVLYRMNAQSNTIENAMIRSGVPYRIIGGLRFYDRKEIKDIISYMSVASNHQDTVRLRRIINEPKRGIGDATVEKAAEIAALVDLPLFEVLKHADQYQPLVKKAKVLMDFIALLESIGEASENLPLGEVFDLLMEKSGYPVALMALGEDGKTRLENVKELKTNIIKYEESAEEPSLSGFLEEVTLYTDMDTYDPDADNITMMTMHSAKGLEFPYVFFCGAEEGIFPGMQSMYDPEQVEEERRLAYVCITRAKQQLYVTNSAQRMIFGQTVRNRISRFAAEIPAECCDVEDKTIRKKTAAPLQDIPPVKKFRSRAVNEIGVGGSSSTSVSGGSCDLKVSDRVNHRTFGDGIVSKITPMGGDFLLEVLFDNAGSKKIMYKFAKLQKLS